MGELGALFNPGMRHELEERQAKAARREEEGNARDGDLRIDLESGVAVINIGADDDDPPDAGNPDTEAPAESSEPAAERDPVVVRPRGKRGMSAARPTKAEPARSPSR